MTEESLQYLSVGGTKLQTVMSVISSEEEEPILVNPIDFRFGDKGSFSSGIIMATYGAVYLFKAKLFGAPEFVDSFHLLNVVEFVVEDNLIHIKENLMELDIKSKDVPLIAKTLLTIFNECTFQVRGAKFLKVISDIQLPPYVVTERPPKALKHRALFFAMYYKVSSDQLHAINYFDRYDEKPGPMMVIGPHFHPGNYAEAFGHAIGWETKCDTLVFQAFAATKFARLFNSVLRHSQTIEKIAFTDYKESRCPRFDKKVIERTSVRKFWFMRTCGNIVCDFLEKSTLISSPIHEIAIASSTMTPQDFGDAVTSIEQSDSAAHLRRIFLVRLSMKPFPFDDLTRLLKCSMRLEFLTVRGLDIDATHLLKSICLAQSPIKSIALTQMQFRTDIPKDLPLPPHILMLNVSNCAFSASSFRSLLQFVATPEVQVPFILSAQNLVIKPIAYYGLQELDFDNCRPNLCEIDWSGNSIPKEPMRFFFAYLFTQSKMHLLMLNEINPADVTQFLSYLVQLVTNLPLPGLDLSGKFANPIFTQFISSLVAAPCIRRLKLKCKNGGDSGLQALTGLIQRLPNLNEVIIDGFRPRTPQPFYELWRVIQAHPSIQTCDLPEEDLKTLGLSIQRMSGEMDAVFNDLKNRPKPSTCSQRLEYMIAQTRLEDDEEFTDTPVTYDPNGFDQNIFRAASTMHWTENTEDAQIDKMAGYTTDVTPSLLEF